MSSSEFDSERIVTLVTQMQRQLYSYIYSLVLNSEDAQEVLQETNLTLWRKRDEIPGVTHFSAWACRVAYFEVLAFRKRAARDKLVIGLDEELLASMAREAEQTAFHDLKSAYLKKCLKRLSGKSFELLQQRYGASQSVEQVAKDVGRSVASITQALYRIRKGLLGCVERRLQAESSQ